MRKDEASRLQQLNEELEAEQPNAPELPEDDGAMQVMLDARPPRRRK